MTSLILAAALAAAGADSKPSIAVLYFDNNTKNADLDVMRKGLADMMVTDLVAWDGVTVVERARLEDVLGELKLQQSKAFDQSTTVKIGRLVGAQYLVVGSMALQDEKLRVDARLIKAEGGVNVAQASVTDDKDKVFEIEQQLVDKLTVAIDIKVKNLDARKKAKVPSLDALVAYSKAVDLSDRGKLEEAQKAMAALVSKSPTFVMAREKKQLLLEKLKEFEARKKDLVSGAVLEVGKLADAELANAKAYPSMDVEKKKRFLAMRALKLRFLARVLKQSLSFRGSPRVVRVGKEAEALKVMKAIASNWRDYIAEIQQYKKVDTWGSVDLSKLGLAELVRDSTLLGDSTSINLSDDIEGRELLAFILDGDLSDGERFDVAPPLGVLEPKEHELALAAYDKDLADAEDAWKKAPADQKLRFENELVQALLAKGELLQRQRRDDDAAAVFQRVLDTFPTSSQAQRAERAIQVIIGSQHDSSRDDRERYQRALKTCDDLNNVSQEASWRMRRKGLAGLDEVAAEIEKACLGRFDAENGLDSFYTSLAYDAAAGEDCARAKKFYLRAYTFGNTGPRSLPSYMKNQPWCDYGLDDETKFPAKLAINARAGELPKALRDVLAEELGARGLAVQAGGGSSHGGVGMIWVDAKLKGGDLELEIDGFNSEPRRVDLNDVKLTTKGGVLDVEALVAPVLKAFPPGSEPGPRKASKSWPVALLAEYDKLVDQYEDARYHPERMPEIEKGFRALAQKNPGFRLATVRADMAASRQVPK